MDFKTKLSQRIQINDIQEVTSLTQDNNARKQELYSLVFNSSDTVAYNATWILNHFSSDENKWLYSKQNELINEVISCPHPGKRRLILALLYRQPLAYPPRVDFLDFCLERMVSKKELPGVQTLCMKLAYELTRIIPELKQELKLTLELMESDLPISIQTVRKNILYAMIKGKSLQKY